MEQGGFVSNDTFTGRKNVCDERFKRDKENISQLEEYLSDVRKLTVATNQLVARHDDIIARHDDKINKQDDRLTSLEKKPGAMWDKVVQALLVAIVSVLATAFISGSVKFG